MANNHSACSCAQGPEGDGDQLPIMSKVIVASVRPKEDDCIYYIESPKESMHYIDD